MAAWKARPLGAWLLRVAIIAVPVILSVLVALGLSRVIDSPRPRTAPWWVLLLAAATATSVVVSRAARRALPLAMLLRLSLAFPDRTPSRFHVALRAGSIGRLQREIERARTHGVGDDVDVAAETVLVLAAALNHHDPMTRGHSERVRALTEVLAAELELSEDDVDRLRWSALLHDCGKLMVHTEVLHREGPLTEEDWEEIRRHPREGAKLTAPLRDWLGSWAAAIEEHHERWDGGGYPAGLTGTEMSYGARIVAVADAYEVMTAARSYKRAMPASEARAELTAQAGRQFDPDVVRAFLRLSLGRAEWLAGFLGWLGGAAVIRAGARAPKDVPTVGLTAAALAIAGILGLFNVAAITAVPAPAPVAVALAERSSSTPPPAELVVPPVEVLGEQFIAPEPAPTPTTTSAPRPPATTTTVPAPPTTTVTIAPVGPASPTPTTIALPLCNEHSGGIASHKLLKPKKPSNNPNCQPPSRG